MNIGAAAAQGCMLLTLLAGQASASPATVDEFACRMRNARQLLDYQRYPQALQELARARPLAGDVPLRGMVIALHAGVAFSQLGDAEQALAAFRAALSADPRARLPLAASPRLLREFEEARLRVAKEANSPSDVPRAREPESPLSAWLREFPRTPPPPPPLDLSVRVLRPRVAVPAAASVALALSGGAFWTLARHEQSRFVNDDPTDDPRDALEVAQVVARIHTYQAVEFSCLGVSLAALGVAISQYVRREPDPREARTSSSPSAVSPFIPLESCT